MSSQSVLEQNFAIFQNLVAQADTYLSKGNHNAAAVYAQIAASYATHNHAGLYISYRLEKILLTIGREIPWQTNMQPLRNRRHVLHVLTEAIGIGGPTRMVWRWIQQDTDSIHSVVLTYQHEAIPQALKDAVKSAGGRTYRLNDQMGNILTWSRNLREIAMSADIVVLHTFPNDVIPLIAFADKRSIPPVVLLNLSDHKFWLGASISDLVVNQRCSGARLTQARRGIDQSKCGFLPIVLPPISRNVSISEAKAKLGISPDTILLLSIARHSKYEPFRDTGSQFNDLVLPDAILPVLQQYPKCVLIVIGPEFTDRWKRASEIVSGRISALGRREDTALYYQAADIYLDSFPFASMTSCLEAGSYSLPLVSCYPFTDVSDVLTSDTPALDDLIIRARNSADFTSVVSHLIENPEYRIQIGKKTKESIIAVHIGDNWKRYLDKLYLQAANTTPTIKLDNKEDQLMISELDVLSLEIDVLKIGEYMVIQDNMRLFPIDLRVKHWIKLVMEHHVFKPSLLLSEWFAVQLIKVRSQMRKIRV